MAKVKVPLYGNPNRAAFLNTRATEGATIGLDLKLPDGSVPSLDELAALIASRVGGATPSAPSRSSAAPTLWRLIREIPPNVQQVEKLSGSGLVTRRADGEWTARAITVADSARLTVADGAGEDGNPVIDLAELADSNDGALLAISRDAWGRVAGTREVVSDDIPELPAEKITSGIFPVERGGTGRDALTAAALLIGAGTDPVDLLAPGDAGHVVRSDGSTWTSAQLGFSDLAGSIDDGQVPESAVKQYEGALSIDWSQLESVPDTASRWPEWTEVTGKPATFPPAPHEHPWGQITGKPDTATRWPAWTEVTDKPTFGTSAFIDEDALSIDWSQISNAPPSGGQVDSVVGTSGQVDVDSSDAANPIISLSSDVLVALSAALSAVQPGDLAAVAFSGNYADLSNKPSIPAGTVTSVNTGTGLTGGPITSAGTIALNQTSIDALALAVSAVQPGDLAPIATLAESALQPGDNISELVNDAGYITSGGGQVDSVVGTPSQIVVNAADPENPVISLDSDVLTALAAALSAVQPGDLSDYARLSTANTYMGTQRIEAAFRQLQMQPSNPAPDQTLYEVTIGNQSGELSVRTRLDDGSGGTQFFRVDRSGPDVTRVRLTGGQITLNGVDVADYAQLSRDASFSRDVSVDGTISGNGSGLTSLNASNLSSGTVPSARLPDTATRWPSWSEVTSKPSTFAPSAHTHNASDINAGTLDNARLSDDVMLTGAYGLGSQDLQNLSSSVDVDFVNTTQFNAKFSSETGPGGQGWAYITLARTPGRVAQIAVRADIADRSNGNLIAVRHSEDASNGLWYPWRFLWHTGNFDPDTKANASHTHSASDITSGTLSDARLPATIGGNKTFSDNVAVGGTISGNGSGLTNLNASNLSSGTVADARLPSEMSAKEFATTLGSIRIGGGVGNYRTYDFTTRNSNATWYFDREIVEYLEFRRHENGEGFSSPFRFDFIDDSLSVAGDVTVGGTLTVGPDAQIFAETSLVAGSDTVIRNTQGATWHEIRGLDGNSGNAGLLVRASANRGGDWTDILRATPAEIQLDADEIDINGPTDISGTLSWGGGSPIASSDDVADTASGSFTATLTGFVGGTIQGTIDWTRTGDVVTLRAPLSITGTSNAATFSMTGLPPEIRPAISNGVVSGGFRDSGSTDVIGLSRVLSTGEITFCGISVSWPLRFAPGFWSDTGTKGLSAGWTITYSRA